MTEKKVLVTGGTGFIGGFTLNELADRCSEIICMARRPPGTPPSPIIFEQGDVTDKEPLMTLVEKNGIDTIVHLAGYGTTMVQSHPELGIRTNILGMNSVLEAALTTGARVVFTSSIAVYGKIVLHDEGPASEDRDVNPVTIYGAGKLLCEKMGMAYAQNHGVGFIGLRVTAVYGYTGLAKHDVDYPTFSDHARRLIELPLAGKEVSVDSGGMQHCDFVYVKDVARAIGNACFAEGLNPGVYNIGSGEVKTLKDFEKIIREHRQDARTNVGEDPNPAYPFMGPVDISRAVRDLQYQPTPFRDSIGDYIRVASAVS
jgi:nucleoside-diphosphate-sugar epimerase